MPFGTIEQAIRDIHDGRFVIVADDEDRENEEVDLRRRVGDPRDHQLHDQARWGMICLALTPERVDQLGLAPMAESNLDVYRTAYTVSVDARVRGSE